LRSAVPSSPMRFTEAGGVNIVDQDLLGAGWRLGLAGGDGFLFSSRRDLGSHDRIRGRNLRGLLLFLRKTDPTSNLVGTLKVRSTLYA
jgi:hypothetical protein